MKDVLLQYSRGKEEILALLKAVIKGYCSDGELAEQLAARFCKEGDVLPNVVCVVRCTMHAKQKNLENALLTDPDVKKIIEELVTKFAGKGEGEHGGFARALRNSDKLRETFGEDVASALAEVRKACLEEGLEYEGPTKCSSAKSAVTVAPQRFDSMLSTLRTIVFNARAVTVFCLRVMSSDGPSAPWASEVLLLLHSLRTRYLLPAITEMMQIVSRHVHGSEGKLSQGKKEKDNIGTLAARDLDMEEELKDMFFERTKGGIKKAPLCIDPAYTRGYTALLKNAFPKKEEIGFVTGSKKAYACFLKGTTEENIRSAAEAVRKMKNIVNVFLQANQVDNGFALACHPFHVSSWEQRGEESRLEETLAPLASIAGVRAEDLAKDMRSVRHYVQGLVKNGCGLADAWKKSVQAYKKTLKALPEALYPVIGMMEGTGQLESNFQLVQLMGQCQKSMDDKNMCTRMKINLDGAPLDDFCKRRLVDGVAEYSPGPLCLRAQHKYAVLHGTKHFHRKRKALSSNTEEDAIPKRRDLGATRGGREGSVNHFLKQQAAQRKRQEPEAEATEEKKAYVETVVAAIDKAGGEMNEAQQVHVLKSQKKKEEKRKLLVDNAMPKGEDEDLKQKYKDFCEDVEMTKQAMKVEEVSMERQLHLERYLDPKDTAFFAPVGTWRNLLKKVVPKENVYKDTIPFLRADAKKKVWLVTCVAGVVQGSCITEESVKGKKPEPLVIAAVGARLFGGYVADESWLARACDLFGISGHLVEPHWKIVPAMQLPLEVIIQDLEEDYQHILGMLIEANPDRIDLTTGEKKLCTRGSKWCFRFKRADVKTDKNGFVICKNNEAVSELCKKKEDRKKEQKEAKKKLKGLAKTSLVFLALKANVKKADEKYSHHRGQPITVQDFIFKKCSCGWASATNTL